MSLSDPAIVGLSAWTSSALAITWGTFFPSGWLWGRVISRGTTNGLPRVALTFDDGPTPGGTDRILDLLAELKAPSTFFVIGQNVERHPDLLRRIDAEGHLVGNHTFDHRRWSVFGHRGFWQDQIQRTDAAIEHVLGKRPQIFRPPMGHKTFMTTAALRRTGQTMVTWNVRCYDGLARTTPQKILDRLLPRCGAGDIVILHDGVEPNRQRDPSATVKALKPLILGLRERGLEPARLDEMTGVSAYFAS